MTRMLKVLLVAACIVACSGLLPAQAQENTFVSVQMREGYRIDCESFSSWLQHVGKAGRRVIGGSFDLGVIQTGWDILPRINAEFNLGNFSSRVFALGAALVLHASPQALLEFGGALVCVVRLDEQPVD